MTRFTLEAVKQKITEDGAEIIGEYSHVVRVTLITFRCNCGETCEKTCRSIY